MVKKDHRGDSKTLGKLFQLYLPAKTHRTYSCLHCRAQLANHDELISKVGEKEETFARGVTLITQLHLVLSVISRQSRPSVPLQFRVGDLHRCMAEMDACHRLFQCQCKYECCRRTRAAHGSSRSRGYLL